MKNIKFIFILLCFGLIHTEAFPQKTSDILFDAVKNYSKKNKQKEYLSMQLLRVATEITYGFNNGSVASEAAYQGYIIVTHDDVTLNIFNLSSLCYSNTYNITSKQYTNFLTNLYALGIKANPDAPMVLCGGGVYDITINKGNKTIFKGIEDEDIVTSKGQLSDAFKPLLNAEMKKVYNDPSITFGTIIDIFPEE